MRIGCVMTVKNEQDTILHNINYHRHIGVTDHFIFLDDPTDGTKGKLKSLPDLAYFEDLTFQDLLKYNIDKPEVELDLIERFYATHLSLRQIVNANMALELCRERGIDWLIQLDSDELVCIDTAQVVRDGFRHFLSQLGDSIECVSFVNIEALPTEVEAIIPFGNQLFKKPGADLGTGNYPKSEIYDPFEDRTIDAGWYWGHSSNKSAIRTCGSAYFVTPHECHTAGEVLTCGYVLHYNISSFRQWLNKYRNFANYPKKPRARPLRLLLIALVNHSGLSDEYLREYYEKYVMYSEDDIKRIRALDQDATLHIHAVADFMQGLG